MKKSDNSQRELLKLREEYDSLKSSYEKLLSEYKRTSEALLEINLALNNSREVIFLTDKEGVITYINPEFTETYGYTADEIVGKTTPRILNNGVFSKEDYKTFWEKLLNKQSIPAWQYKNKCKNGKLIDVEGSADPIVNEEGEIIGFLGIQRDITERKKAEKALKESEQQLRELNATKDKFFSIIAHDLKNPFNLLLGLSELLKESLEENGTTKQHQYIDKIYKSTKDTSKLLENLLIWARTQKGIIDFSPTEENIHSLVDKEVKLLNQLAEKKSISLINKIPDGLTVSVDKNMFSTIIRNLISNGIKYTYHGGTIEINSQSVKENNQHFIEISVKDNGIGIPSEIQDKLFSISENISTEGTENETGTGLGLILCKEFVQKHSGKIWVESEVGKGSKFTFTIPTIS